MPVKLIKLTKKYKNQLVEMIDEWKKDQEENNTDRSPYAIFKNSYEDFDYYLKNLASDKPMNGWVPNSVYFLYSESKDKLIGAVDIRHRLNRHLMKYGGHIGDGIRPSYRGLGFGKLILELALQECIKLGINNVLICCNKNNIPSKRAILSVGGTLKNTVIDEDGEEMERYWVNAPRELLLRNIDEVHVSEETAKRLKKKVGLYECEILSEIEDAITFHKSYTVVTLKNNKYYVRYRDVEYIIDANDYSVLNIRIKKPKK